MGSRSDTEKSLYPRVPVSLCPRVMRSGDEIAPRRHPHGNALPLGLFHGHRPASGSFFAVPCLSLDSFCRNVRNGPHSRRQRVLPANDLGRNSALELRIRVHSTRKFSGASSLKRPVPGPGAMDHKDRHRFLGRGHFIGHDPCPTRPPH